MQAFGVYADGASPKNPFLSRLTLPISGEVFNYDFQKRKRVAGIPRTKTKNILREISRRKMLTKLTLLTSNGAGNSFLPLIPSSTPFSFLVA
jgi:hypothetical protein